MLTLHHWARTVILFLWKAAKPISSQMKGQGMMCTVWLLKKVGKSSLNAHLKWLDEKPTTGNKSSHNQNLNSHLQELWYPRQYIYAVSVQPLESRVSLKRKSCPSPHRRREKVECQIDIFLELIFCPLLHRLASIQVKIIWKFLLLREREGRLKYHSISTSFWHFQIFRAIQFGYIYVVKPSCFSWS